MAAIMANKPSQLLVLVRKYKSRCVYCDQRVSMALPEAHPLRATRDHLLPRSLGGSNGLSNLVLACRNCNQTRGNQKPQPSNSMTAAQKRAIAAANLLAMP